MINEPRVSIVTATYNSAKTVEDTLRSVIGQTYRNIEYIIVDGGSTDGTLDILDRYRDHIAVLISEPDGGIYDAFNKGVRRARGEIVAILNSDDCYHDETVIEDVVAAFVEHDVDLVYGDMELLLHDGSGQRRLIKADIGGLKSRSTLHHPAVFVAQRVYRTDLYDDSYRLVADYEFMLRLHLAGKRFFYLERPLAVMRTGGASHSRRIFAEAFRVHRQYFGLPYAAYRFTAMYGLQWGKDLRTRVLRRVLPDRVFSSLKKYWWSLRFNTKS